MNRLVGAILGAALVSVSVTSTGSAAPIVAAETALGLSLKIVPEFVGSPYLDYSVTLVDEVLSPATIVSGIGSATADKGWPYQGPSYAFGPVGAVVSVGASVSVTGPGSAFASARYTGAMRVTNTGAETRAPNMLFYAIGKEDGLALINDLLTDTASYRASGSFEIDGYGGSPIGNVLQCSAADRFGDPFSPPACAFPLIFTTAGALSFSPAIPLDPGQFFDVKFTIDVFTEASSTADVASPGTALLFMGVLPLLASTLLMRRRRNAQLQIV